MKHNKTETMDWALWFYWIIATTIGWLIGRLFFLGIPVILSGVVISALQWAILYQRIHKAWRWAVYSSAGWVIGYILFVVLSANNPVYPAGSVIGLVVGIVQWVILKRVLNWAGWWIIISTLAWTTGMNIIPGLLTSGALPGALTGLTLAILFRYSTP
jgi:hypothetical protein